MKKEKIISVFVVSLISANLSFADRPAAPEAVEPAPVAPAVPALPAEVSSSKKAFLGVVTSSVRKSTAIQLGLTPGFGLTVESVVKGSSAEEFGIEKYDILLEMGGQMLTSVSHFTALLSIRKPGDEVEFTVFRQGVRKKINVTLGDKSVKKKMHFDFDEKIDAFSDHIEHFIEENEYSRFLEEEELSKIGDKVRAALEKTRYRLESIAEDANTSRTSIINSGVTRTIDSCEDGTLILESKGDEESKLIAIDSDGEVLYKGAVSEDGKELDELDEWILTRYKKLTRDKVNVIVTNEITIEEEDAVIGSD